MGESAAGEQGRHQVISCYDNNDVIKITVTWFLLTVLESVLRRVRGGEGEVMNLQLETHGESEAFMATLKDLPISCTHR